MSTVGSATSTSTTTNTETAAANQQLAEDLDQFLTLLTTQLKNQDPLSPMDSTEFTNQLVQFAQVEQAINQNDKLDSLIDLNTANQAAFAVNYIGMYAEAESSKVPVQDGSARFAYGVGEDAKSVGIMIQDSSGSTVYTASGETNAGVHEFNWDGKDSDGNQLEDGTYTISVTALDNDGASIDTYTTVFGRVTGVTSQDGETVLVMGDLAVSLSNVLSVTPEEENATASDDSDTSTTDTSTSESSKRASSAATSAASGAAAAAGATANGKLATFLKS